MDNPGAVITGEDGKTIREGIINYAERVAGKMTKRNLGYYVYQEGEVDEAAEWRDPPRTKDTARDALLTYLSGLSYIRYRIGSIDEDDLYAFATVWKDNADGTATELNLIVWKDGGNPITHLELTA